MINKSDLRFFCKIDDQVCTAQITGDGGKIVIPETGYVLGVIDNKSKETVLVKALFEGMHLDSLTSELVGGLFVPRETTVAFEIDIIDKNGFVVVNFFNDVNGYKQNPNPGGYEKNVEKFKPHQSPFTTLKIIIVKGLGKQNDFWA